MEWWPFKIYERSFLFNLKNYFPSQAIQVFVFQSSPLYLPVTQCFRAWSKINIKFYDVINALNKNFIKQFVWHLEKKKRHHFEILAIDTALSKEHFYANFIQKMCTKNYSQTPVLFW